MSNSFTVRTSSAIFAATIVSVLLGSPRPLVAETIVDAANGFTLELPDGFAARPELVNPSQDVIHAFVYTETINDELPIHFFIVQFSGTIGPDQRLEQSAAAMDFQGRTFSANWKSFEVEAAVVPERMGELEATTYNVPIPLKDRAIQIKLLGPSSSESELQRLLSEILGGLKGESNWAQAKPEEPAIQGQRKLPVALTFGIVLVLCVALVLVLRFMKSPARNLSRR